VNKWRIHSTAIIHASAQIAEDVEIGPYCMIGENVKIGKGSVLHAHVTIEQNTSLGADCEVYEAPSSAERLKTTNITAKRPGSRSAIVTPSGSCHRSSSYRRGRGDPPRRR